MDRIPGRHLALVGATASGKSEVALALARRRNLAGSPTEIVSCDSMQVYRGMDIGTAKPTSAERAEVRHHLLDLVDPDDDHNLPRFLRSARAAIDGIEARGASALLVGGTGLYVRGIVDGFDPPPHFPELAARLEAECDTAELTRRLAEADPAALERIPVGNRRRLVRALEVTVGTGIPFSAHNRAPEPYVPTPFVLAGLWVDRDTLTERIAARYEAQMAAGFLEEVRALAARRPPMSRTARQALGYRELLAHLEDGADLAEAMGTARVRTRRFAVRQQRWFGRDPRIEWFGPPGPGRPAEEVAGELDRLWGKRASGRHMSVATVDDGPAGGPGPHGAAGGPAPDRPPTQEQP